MKYRMIGHNMKKAVEEIMIILFPNQKLEFSQAVDDNFEKGDNLISGLRTEGDCCIAFAELTMRGEKANGYCRVNISGLGEQEIKRQQSYAIREAIYSAGRHFLTYPPEWGSMTGVRPSKTALNELIAVGGREEEAVRLLMDRYHISQRRGNLAIECAVIGRKAVKDMTQRDICLYISIPFCPTRCKYCSFVSRSISEAGYLVDKYIDALLMEVKTVSEAVRRAGLRVRAVYIGGGTPTSLDAEQLKCVMAAVKDCFDLSGICEYTVEAGRPDTITDEKLKVMFLNGADRISINPQSMNPEVLRAALRPHSPEDTVKTFIMARDAGFKIINMDVIAGLEMDTQDSFEETIEKVLSLAPENITVHTLSYKKGADMKQEQMRFDNNKICGMLDYAYRKVRYKGYSPYYVYRQKYMAGAFENTGFCLEGTENLYNIAVMEESMGIIALGAGASTKLLNHKTGEIVRYFNVKYPYEYVLDTDRFLMNADKIYRFYNSVLETQ